MSKRAAEARGRRGEALAAWWLRLHGWRILGQRVKTRAGEVDIIARRQRMLVFVEVKTRRKREDLSFAIDAWRLRRVARAAQLLLSRYARDGDSVRIDVMLLAPWTMPRVIQDAWREGDS